VTRSGKVLLLEMVGLFVSCKDSLDLLLDDTIKEDGWQRTHVLYHVLIISN